MGNYKPQHNQVTFGGVTHEHQNNLIFLYRLVGYNADSRTLRKETATTFYQVPTGKQLRIVGVHTTQKVGAQIVDWGESDATEEAPDTIQFRSRANNGSVEWATDFIIPAENYLSATMGGLFCEGIYAIGLLEDA